MSRRTGTAAQWRGTIGQPQLPDDGKAAARRAVVDGPVLKTLFRLALPTIVVLVAQTLVGIVETYYVSRLGTDLNRAGFAGGSNS